MLEQRVPVWVSPGAEYNLYAYIRGVLDTDESRGSWHIAAYFYRSDYTSSQTIIVDSGDPGAVSTSWQKKGGRVTAPADAVYVRIMLHNYFNSGWVTYDDVSLTRTLPTPVTRMYYYAGDRRVALRVAGDPDPAQNGLFYLISDHLGSTSITADASGAKVAELRYKPWGETRYTSGSTPTARRYTGQREFAVLGLYHYGARFYDPSIMRWLSPDPIVPSIMRWLSPDPIVPGIGEGSNPNAVGCLGASNYSPLTVDYHENQLLEQQNLENRTRLQDPTFKLPPFPTNSIAFDRYAYSLNNPIRYTDPTGHCPICAAAAITLGAITPVGWVAVSVTVVGVGLYYALPSVREAVTAGFEQAGEAVSDAASAAANGLAAVSQANQLPKTGDFPYVPPKQKSSPPYVRAPQGGFKDANGNIWRRDKSAHGGPHWDVEHPDGSHTNVDDTGKIIRKKK